MLQKQPPPSKNGAPNLLGLQNQAAPAKSLSSTKAGSVAGTAKIPYIP